MSTEPAIFSMFFMESVNSSNPDLCCSSPAFKIASTSPFVMELTSSFFSSSSSYMRPAAYPVPAPRAAPPGPPIAPRAAPEIVAAGVTNDLIEHDERLNSKAVSSATFIGKKGVEGLDLRPLRRISKLN